MEVSARRKVFCGNIWVTGKVGSLGNTTGTAKVGEFGYILGDTSEYLKFGHLLYALMVSAYKALMDEFSIEIMDIDHDTWLKKAMWIIRV